MAGSTFGGLDDLLGLGALAPPAQHVTSVKAVPLQDPAVLLRALALKDKGVLWEDRHLQLGVTADFIQHTGHIGLFLGNKHTAPLTRLRADVHGVDRREASRERERQGHARRIRAQPQGPDVLLRPRL